ncbi:beta-carotene 15,15'-monooxygenase [Chryseobacterium sp. FH2]|uniref:DUF2339 domain-containing protein n=1 Tax=Chryseobacterium sp. FH2 TaxID=1674291 RepID=UPI00065A98CB|nr:DUF2339 domain-containing protein [Chryseobacterium sp. FH2]KMQ67482.1 beta-carotene 15,15'-monooxygenase [Chryseobacterium sp. FH2]
MDNTIIIILIIVTLLVYYRLNNRINELENKISELTKKDNKAESPIEVIQQTTTPLQAEVSFKADLPEANQHKTKPEEKFPDIPQKDWLTPIFDFLKQNALTVIGIVTLVLGIGYFVKYAIDKNWIGETTRVAIGIAIGTIIIVIGQFLRKNYTVFSSIITGGGIAVLYFTITIAFREYHLFSQNIAFFLTSIITLLSIALSYYYKSEILITFSLFGGFLAPLMISTGESNYLFLFTYLTVLNVGMLVIVFLKNWRSAGWIAFIFTGIYLFYWTAEKTEILSIYFYILTYIIFYAYALQDYFKTNKLSSGDILMLVLINFSSIIGLVYIFNELQYEPVIIFPVVFAFINSILLFRENSKKDFGTNYSVFAAITISLVTLAIALQFKTHLITSVWAIEATLLLFIWKKTRLTIFKICFYVLFPMVILSQFTTWTEYYNAKQLNIIFNPVFLTSTVTIITTLTNLILLRKLSGKKDETDFFEGIFTFVSYGVIYLALLLEIIYHISEKPLSFILSISFLYSICYIFVLLLLRKILELNKFFETGLIYQVILLVVINSSFVSSEITDSVLLKELQKNYFIFQLLYLIPFVYLIWKIFPKSDFFKTNISYWLISFTITILVSFELYHLYILGNADNITESYQLQNHFSILYLPIIWAVLASIFIYRGLKNDISELSKAGFMLIGIMILKLYTYDVWQMDNVSRIIAFIILGIILLLSSFTFQRLKNIIKNLVDKKEGNHENNNTESQ